jgi:hypothetical protein
VTARTLRRAAVALISVVALAGCGGSSGVKSATYVKSVCIALSTWRNSVQAAGTQLQSATPKNKSVSDAKHATQAFVASLLRATTSAASALKAAGVPAVSGGKQVSAGLVSAFDGAQKALAGAASRASVLPTTSEPAFVSAENEVTTEIRNALTSMNDVSPSTNPQLRKEIESQAECADLRAS